MDPRDPLGGPAERLTRFATLVDGDAALVPLDRTALAIAAVLRGEVDVHGALEVLDRLAAGCPERSFDGLRRYLFEAVGLEGDHRRYDDPANSFLDVVLARSRGLPILLATVMLEVGRRAGIGVVGIGMPMHFLVGDPRDPDVLADPFSGAALDRAGARAMFESMAEGRLPWDDHHLDPVPARAIIARMLANLRASYARRHDALRLALVARMRWQVPELRAEIADAPRASAIFN